MRVTIDHREEITDLLGRKRLYCVDCTIEFSEEEKAIIRSRGLQEHLVPIPSGYLVVPDPYELRRAYVLKFVIASAVCVAGFILSLFDRYGPLSLFAAIMAIAGVIYASWCLNRIFFPKDEKSDHITLDTVIKRGRFCVRTFSPAEAKSVADQLESGLAGTKDFLTVSAEMPPGRTVEL